MIFCDSKADDCHLLLKFFCTDETNDVFELYILQNAGYFYRKEEVIEFITETRNRKAASHFPLLSYIDQIIALLA